MLLLLLLLNQLDDATEAGVKLYMGVREGGLVEVSSTHPFSPLFDRSLSLPPNTTWSDVSCVAVESGVVAVAEKINEGFVGGRGENSVGLEDKKEKRGKEEINDVILTIFNAVPPLVNFELRFVFLPVYLFKLSLYFLSFCFFIFIMELTNNYCIFFESVSFRILLIPSSPSQLPQLIASSYIILSKHFKHISNLFFLWFSFPSTEHHCVEKPTRKSE